MRNCDFSGLDLSGKTLSAINAAGASFEGANLQNAIMTRIYARRANFKGANLESATLYEAQLQGADLRDASLANALMSTVFLGKDEGQANVAAHSAGVSAFGHCFGNRATHAVGTQFLWRNVNGPVPSTSSLP